MFQTRRFFKVAMTIAIACIVTLFVATASGIAAVQEVKTTLFKEANAARIETGACQKFYETRSL